MDQGESLALPWVQAVTTNKVLAVLLVLSMVGNICMAFGFSYLFPLKTIEPVIVEFSSSRNNFVTVASGRQNLTSNFMLIRHFLRQYVVQREKIDKITEEQRYQVVYAMSGDEVSQSFRAVYGDPEKGLFFIDKFKRDITITRDDPLAKGIHQVEFITTDTYDDERGTEESEWVATISYKFVDQMVTYSEADFNPLGLIVTEYSLSKRKR